MGPESVSLLAGLPLNRALGALMESYKVQLLNSLIKQTNLLGPKDGLTVIDFAKMTDQLPSVDPLGDWQPAVPLDLSRASNLNLSAEAKNITQLTHELFDTPESRNQHLKTLVEFSREHPSLWKPTAVFLSAIKGQGVENSDISKAIDLIKSMAVLIRGNPLSINSEESGINLFAKQALQQMTATMVMQHDVPVQARATPKELIQFFDYAFKERPATFEKEVFSLPIAQKSGLNLVEYMAITDELDPLKLALTLIHLRSKKNSQTMPPLEEFSTEVKKSLLDSKPLKPVLEFFQKKYDIQDLEIIKEKPRDQMRYMSDGVLWVGAGKERYVAALALSPDKGVLPDASWHVLSPNASMLSIQGGLFLTQHLGPGLQRIKLSVEGDGQDDEVLAELLLYCVMGMSDEEESAQQRQESEGRERQQNNDLPYQTDTQIQAPVGGEVAIKLVSPFILTRPFKNNQPINSGLTFRFRFLADLLHPERRYSRDQFLTLQTGAEVAALRGAVKKMSQGGLGNFDEYLAAVNGLLMEIKKIIPESGETFSNAQKFLRDEVLMYFMGKKSVLELRSQQLVEKTGKGDVLASICSVTSDLLSSCDLESDALVSLVDATTLAQSKPKYLERIRDFFTVLRQRMGSTESPPTLALASEFVEKVTII